MSLSRQLYALAATARIANLPGVAVNVWLGIALAIATGGGLTNSQTWRTAALLGLAGACLYLAGNFLNDWADREWDAARRHERALPQGLFPPRGYLTVALLCGLLGLLAAALVNHPSLVVALMILLCIILYTQVHKRAAWSVIPLGLCRGLLPILGFVGVAAREVIPVAGLSAQSTELPAVVAACACGLFCHIVGLSLSARHESLDHPPERAMRIARLWFPAAAAAMWVASSRCLSLPMVPCVLGLLPYGLWTALSLTVFRQPVSAHVASLLAGIPLVDWIVLLPLSQALGAHGLPAGLATICLLLPPVAFVLGRLLQRLAPAT